jgi:uncharacterized caspase-like protein
MHIDESEVIEVALLYEAGLGRQFDGEGLNYWIDQYDDVPLDNIGRSFLVSDEFTVQFGDAYEISDAAFIDAMYDNVLDRDADADGFAFWSGALNGGGYDRDDVLVQFALSTENYGQSPYVYDLHEVSSGYWGL